MTREERRQAADKYVDNFGCKKKDTPVLSAYYLGYVAGAEWADEHQRNLWISVEDRLPDRAWSNKMGCLTEDSDIVFAMASSGKLFCNLYYSYELKNFLEKSAGLNGMDRALRYDKVTHWMPIPELKN